MKYLVYSPSVKKERPSYFPKRRYGNTDQKLALQLINKFYTAYTQGLMEEVFKKCDTPLSKEGLCKAEVVKCQVCW